MRHLGSVVLAILAAPLVPLLAGRGLTAFVEATAAGRTDPLATVVAFAALSAAGLLYAVLTLPRLSPLGPALAGVGYLAFGALLLMGPADLFDRLAHEGIRLDAAQVTAAAATATLLALPLLLTVFSAQRWRGRDDAPAPVGAHPAYRRPLADTQEMPTITLT